MMERPTDVLNLFPVRKNKKQKQAFRQEIRAYAQSLGYEYTEEKGSFGSRNLILGNPDEADFLITAHYDTPAGLPFPNLVTPCNFLPFLAYQLFVTVLIFLGTLAVTLGTTLLIPPLQEITPVVAYVTVWVFLIGMLVGPANRHNANDNTSGVVTLLETAGALPEELRSRVCFVLFDLEEAGLIGSSSYRKKHKKQTGRQLILNLDCVGDGDSIMFFPTGKARKNKAAMEAVSRICGVQQGKEISLRRRGFAYYPSDQRNFPWGFGICALRKSRFGLYLGRIHTRRDTVLDENNVTVLRDCLIRMVADAVQ